jgi:stress response protein YsnF
MGLPNFNKKNNSSMSENRIKNVDDNETNKKNNENPNRISPKKPKNSRMTIKPSIIHQEGSFSTKVDHLFESVKEKTSDYFDKVKIKQYNINSFATTPTTITTTNMQEANKVRNQQEFVIPVLEEKYTLSKNTVLEDIKIEKKWITHNEKIQIPVSYEKLFVNDKELDAYSKENIFTHIKDKILDFVYVEGSTNENKFENEANEEVDQKEQDKLMDKYHDTKNEKEIQRVSGERVSLFDDEKKANFTNDKNNNTIQNDNTQKVIPLYAEEIIITKRKVKVGEIIITKRKLTEVKKIDLDIVKEKVTVDYANGRKENITDS